METIDSFPRHKSGNDGLPAEIYRCLLDKIKGHLINSNKSLLENGQLGITKKKKKNMILLIPKKDK